VAVPPKSPLIDIRPPVAYAGQSDDRHVTPPLGLPAGSVRALLVVMLTLTLWYLVLLEKVVPDYLADTAFLAIAFYFGERSTREGIGTAKRQPLYMPRGVVRGAIVGGFFTVYVYQWISGHQIPPVVTSIVDILAGYAVGVAVSLAVRASTRKARSGALAAFGHARALLTLAGVAFLCSISVTGQDAMVPPVYLTVLDLLVAFYFGSRSVWGS